MCFAERKGKLNMIHLETSMGTVNGTKKGQSGSLVYKALTIRNLQQSTQIPPFEIICQQQGYLAGLTIFCAHNLKLTEQAIVDDVVHQGDR